MDKQTFHSKWYFRLLQVVFWGSLFCFSVTLILLGYFGSDVEISGFVLSAVLAFIYWLLKRMLYYILFAESMLPGKLSTKKHQ